MKTSIRSVSLQIFSLAVLLGAWQGFVFVRPDFSFVTGSPLGVIHALTTAPILDRLPLDALLTTGQALIGFVIGTGAGTLLGLSLWLSRSLLQIAKPYLIFLGAVPIFALGPIFVFWFGTELVSKVALAVVATFSLAALQAYQGARLCDPNLVRLGIAFGASRLQLLAKLIAPSALTWVIGASRINIGAALLASVVGEFISSRAGLGNLLIYAEGLYDINLMLGSVLCIGTIAVLLNSIVNPVENWVRRTSPEATSSLSPWTST